MKRITFREIQRKDVINLCDGTRIGNVTELELDSCTGQICTLVISRSTSICCFGRDNSIALPWSRIECIGEDAILTNISSSELEKLIFSKRKRFDAKL